MRYAILLGLAAALLALLSGCAPTAGPSRTTPAAPAGAEAGPGAAKVSFNVPTVT